MEAVLEFVQHSPAGMGLAVVFLAAGLEYLIPPLPADTVVLSGSLLVVAGVHSFVTVLVCAVAGGAFGAAFHFYLGKRCTRSDGTIVGGRYVEKLIGEGNLDRFFTAFRKYGMWVIALNRAFPGVRAVTFFAAGAARLPFIRTMAFGLVSNVAWSLAVLVLGVSVGGSWEKIQEVFSVYKSVVYVVGGVGLALYVAYRLYAYRRRRVLGSDAESAKEN